MGSAQAQKTRSNAGTASSLACHPRNTLGRESTAANSEQTVARLHKQVMAAEEKVDGLQAAVDRRRHLLASMEVMNADLTAAARREKLAHEETQSRNRALQEQIAESREREAELLWQVQDLKKTLREQSTAKTAYESAQKEGEELESKLHQAELKERILRCALSSAFQMLPEMSRQTSYDQVYNFAKGVILAKVESVATPPPPTGAVVSAPINHIALKTRPQTPLPIRKKRKIDDNEGQGADLDNKKPPSSGGLLSPPPSARKKQPTRYGKSKAPGFYTERVTDLQNTRRH